MTVDLKHGVGSQRSRAARFGLGVRAVLGAIACLAPGCLNQPVARNVIGPSGQPAVHVSCGADQGACVELAGRSCPNGYDLSPLFDPHDNNFLVTCRTAPANFAYGAVANQGAHSWPTPPPPWPIASGTPTPNYLEAPSTIGTRNESEVDLGY